MLTIGALFAYLPAGTMVTIDDDKGYLVLNEPFDNIQATLPTDFKGREVKKISAGYKSFHIGLYGKEE